MLPCQVRVGCNDNPIQQKCRSWQVDVWIQYTVQNLSSRSWSKGKMMQYTAVLHWLFKFTRQHLLTGCDIVNHHMHIN